VEGTFSVGGLDFEAAGGSGRKAEGGVEEAGFGGRRDRRDERDAAVHGIDSVHKVFSCVD